MQSPRATISIREKLAYALGDCGANFIFQSQISFLLFFYTDVFGISAAAAGTILMLSRICDAVNDPIIGALADRTPTRWGRYRPWILVSAAPLAVALVLCYTTPALGSTGKIIWAAVTYNLLMIFYAANNVPYSALSGVMTDDSAERTGLLSWRFFCAMGGTLLVNMLTVDLVKRLGQGNPAAGYQWTMAVWGALAGVCFLLTFAFTTERIEPSPRQHSTVRRDLADLIRCGPWFSLFLLAVLVHVQLQLRGGAMLHYFTHYVREQNLPGWLGRVVPLSNFGLFNTIGLAAVMVGLFFAKPLSERLGKRATFLVCLLVSAALMCLFAFVPNDKLWPLFTLQVVMQLAFAPTIPLLWTMMADVADYIEWTSGRRSTGLTFASIVFGHKLGLGLGIWISGTWLGYIGYAPPAEPSTAASRGIVLLVSYFPAAALLLSAVVLLFYGIDDRLDRQIKEELRTRRLRRSDTDR